MSVKDLTPAMNKSDLIKDPTTNKISTWIASTESDRLVPGSKEKAWVFPPNQVLNVKEEDEGGWVYANEAGLVTHWALLSPNYMPDGCRGFKGKMKDGDYCVDYGKPYQLENEGALASGKTIAEKAEALWQAWKSEDPVYSFLASGGEYTILPPQTITDAPVLQYGGWLYRHTEDDKVIYHLEELVVNTFMRLKRSELDVMPCPEVAALRKTIGNSLAWCKDHPEVFFLNPGTGVFKGFTDWRCNTGEDHIGIDGDIECIEAEPPRAWHLSDKISVFDPAKASWFPWPQTTQNVVSMANISDFTWIPPRQSEGVDQVCSHGGMAFKIKGVTDHGYFSGLASIQLGERAEKPQKKEKKKKKDNASPESLGVRCSPLRFAVVLSSLMYF